MEVIKTALHCGYSLDIKNRIKHYQSRYDNDFAVEKINVYILNFTPKEIYDLKIYLSVSKFLLHFNTKHYYCAT